MTFKEINRQPSRAERFKLSLVLLIGFGLIGLLQLRSDRPKAALALGLMALGLFVLANVPPAGRVLYVVWMGLGVALGFVTQPVVMMVAYGLLFVPLGLAFRLAGRDLLKRKTTAQPSYWEECPPAEDAQRYFRQY